MDSIVEFGGLRFHKLYSREQIDQEVDRIAAEIDAYFLNILKKDPQAKFTVLGVLNGAFMYVSQLVRRLKTRVFIDFIRMKSYQGTQSGQVSILTKINPELINNCYVLVVDDICDTGKTLIKLDSLLKKENAKQVKFSTLIIRPDKEHQLKPEFTGLSCSGFIIGYGLDFNQQARQLPEIYQKIDSK